MKQVTFVIVTMLNLLLGCGILYFLIWAKNPMLRYILGTSIVLVALSIIAFWIKIGAGTKSNLILGAIPAILAIISFLSFNHLAKQ